MALLSSLALLLSSSWLTSSFLSSPPPMRCPSLLSLPWTMLILGHPQYFLAFDKKYNWVVIWNSFSFSCTPCSAVFGKVLLKEGAVNVLFLSSLPLFMWLHSEMRSGGDLIWMKTQALESLTLTQLDGGDKNFPKKDYKTGFNLQEKQIMESMTWKSHSSQSWENRPEHNEMEFYYLQQSYSEEGVHQYHLQSFPSMWKTGASHHSYNRTCSRLIFPCHNENSTIRQCFYIQLL